MVFYKYVSAKRIDILQNRLIRFTQPKALNDPFEAQPYFYALGKKGFASAYADCIRRAPYRAWKDYKRVMRTDLDRFALASKVENDPDYAEWLYKKLHKQGLDDLLDELLDKFDFFAPLHNTAGILSLSKTRDNLLMWAHYTEGHTGFVLVLDGTHDFFKGDRAWHGFAKPAPVEYRCERPRLRAEETSKETVMSEIFFVKSLDWKYEKEWRYLKFRAYANKLCRDSNDLDVNLFKNDLDVNLFKLPPKCVIGVILGSKSSPELKEKILALQREDPEFGHLQIQQARASETHYRLEIGEI